MGNAGAGARAAVEALAGHICQLWQVRRNADETGGARYHRRAAPEATRLAIVRRSHPPAGGALAQGKKGAATMIRVLSVALSLAVLAPGNQPASSQQLTTLYSGDCVGVVATLISIGPVLEPDYRFCFPQGGNTEQAMLAVIALLEKKPAVLQLDFRVLAATTMRESWPCKP